MPQVDTPWVGLAALAAMFALPFLPSWLLDGPRSIRHRPRRHVCADCGAPWSPSHVCELEEPPDPRLLRAQLRQVPPSSALVPRTLSPPKTRNS